MKKFIEKNDLRTYKTAKEGESGPFCGWRLEVGKPIKAIGVCLGYAGVWDEPGEYVSGGEEF